MGNQVTRFPVLSENSRRGISRGFQGTSFNSGVTFGSSSEGGHPPIVRSALFDLESFSKRSTIASTLPRFSGSDRSNIRVLEFHWNPTAYNIKKAARWGTQPTDTSVDRINYNGSDPIVITFDAFFNEYGHPHDSRPLQRSSQDSIDWLFSRMRPSVRKVDGSPNAFTTDKASPPILVFTGLSRAFVCVLTSVTVSTQIQKDKLRASMQPNFQIKKTILPNDVDRAVVSIELKEYSI